MSTAIGPFHDARDEARSRRNRTGYRRGIVIVGGHDVVSGSTDAKSENLMKSIDALGTCFGVDL